MSDEEGGQVQPPPTGPPAGPESPGAAPPPSPPPPPVAPSAMVPPPPSAYAGGSGVQLREMGIGETLDTAIKIYRRNWKTLIAVVAIVVIPVELVHQLLVLSSVHTVTVNGHTLYVAQSDLDTNRTLSLIFGLGEFVLVAP